MASVDRVASRRAEKQQEAAWSCPEPRGSTCPSSLPSQLHSTMPSAPSSAWKLLPSLFLPIPAMVSISVWPRRRNSFRLPTQDLSPAPNEAARTKALGTISALPGGGLQPGSTPLCQKVGTAERWAEREEPRRAAGSGRCPLYVSEDPQDEGRYPFGSLATHQLYTQACLFPYKTIFLFYTKSTPPLPRTSAPHSCGTSPEGRG